LRSHESVRMLNTMFAHSNLAIGDASDPFFIDGAMIMAKLNAAGARCRWRAYISYLHSSVQRFWLLIWHDPAPLSALTRRAAS
jgi:hypothetical protein